MKNRRTDNTNLYSGIPKCSLSYSDKDNNKLILITFRGTIIIY